MEWNSLNSLPDTFGDLKVLKGLYLNDNSLKKLPNSIGNLENLEFFDLTNNPLESLPESFENLTSLKTLKMAHTVTKFPQALLKLKSLEEIQLDVYLDSSDNTKKLIEQLEDNGVWIKWIGG
ncbi:MAG: leucine-rich repeat domain-containing protein [Promethearchaeota archaeon]